MINLLCLIFSLCLQFGAVGVTPYNMTNLNSENEYLIDEIKSRIASNYGGFWYNYYHTFLDVPNEQWVVVKGYYNNSYRDKIVVCCPREAVGIGSSSISASAYTTYDGDNNLVSGIQLYLGNYAGFHYFDSGVENDMSIYGQSWYNFEGGDWSMLYCTKPIYSGETLVVDTYNAIEIVTGNPLGSLGTGGHSSGGSPLDSLGGVNWYSVTGHSTGGSIAPSPHSSSTHFNTTTQQPSTNDSKTDNLLYMLGDKLADITENTSGIISALGGVMYNVMQGASAIFNGISAFNDNVNNFFGYLTAVPTSQDISDALDECENIGSLRDLSESINIWSELGLTQVNSAPSYTFNFNGTMFESMGNFTLNFNFLDSTKNLWQPLFIALLYFNLLITILTGLPDLIQGRGET